MKVGFFLCLLLLGALADYTLIDYNGPVTNQALEPCSVYVLRVAFPEGQIPVVKFDINTTTTFTPGDFSIRAYHLSYLPNENDFDFSGGNELINVNPVTNTYTSEVVSCRSAENYIVIHNDGNLVFDFDFEFVSEVIPQNRIFNVLLRPEDKIFNFVNVLPSSVEKYSEFVFINVSLANGVVLDTFESMDIVVEGDSFYDLYASNVGYDISECAGSVSTPFSYEISECQPENTQAYLAVKVPLNGRFYVRVNHNRNKIYDQISPISKSNVGKLYTGNYDETQFFQLDISSFDLNDKSLIINLDNNHLDDITLYVLTRGLCSQTQYLCSANGKLGCKYIFDSCTLQQYVDAGLTTFYLITNAGPAETFRLSANLFSNKVGKISVGDSKLETINVGETRHYKIEGIPDMSCKSEDVVNVHIYSDVPSDSVTLSFKHGSPETNCETISTKTCTTISGKTGYGCSVQLLPCDIEKFGTEWYITVSTDTQSDNMFYQSTVTYTINTEVVGPREIVDTIGTLSTYSNIYTIVKVPSSKVKDESYMTFFISSEDYLPSTSVPFFYVHRSFGKIMTTTETDCFPNGGISTQFSGSYEFSEEKCLNTEYPEFEEDLYIVIAPIGTPYGHIINYASTFETYNFVEIPQGTTEYRPPDYRIGEPGVLEENVELFLTYTPSKDSSYFKFVPILEGDSSSVNMYVSMYTDSYMCGNYLDSNYCSGNNCPVSTHLCDVNKIFIELTISGSQPADYVGRILIKLAEGKGEIFDIKPGDHKQICTHNPYATFKFTAPGENYKNNYIFELYDNLFGHTLNGASVELTDKLVTCDVDPDSFSYSNSNEGVMTLPACDVVENKEYFFTVERQMGEESIATCFSYKFTERKPTQYIGVGKTVHDEIHYSESNMYKFNIAWNSTNYFDSNFNPILKFDFSSSHDPEYLAMVRYASEDECDCHESTQLPCVGSPCSFEIHYCEKNNYIDGEYGVFVRGDNQRTSYSLSIDNSLSSRLSDLIYDRLYTYKLSDEKQFKTFMYRLPNVTQDSYVLFDIKGFSSSLTFYVNENGPATSKCSSSSFPVEFVSMPPAELSNLRVFHPLCANIRYFNSFVPTNINDNSYLQINSQIRVPEALAKSSALTTLSKNFEELQYYSISLDAGEYTYFAYTSNATITVSLVEDGICGEETLICTGASCSYVIPPCNNQKYKFLKVTFSDEYADVQYILDNMSLNEATLTSGSSVTANLGALDNTGYNSAYRLYKIQVAGEERAQSTISFSAGGLGYDSYYFATDSSSSALSQCVQPDTLSCCKNPGYYYFVVKNTIAVDNTVSVLATISPFSVLKEYTSGSVKLDTDNGKRNYFTTNLDANLKDAIINVQYEVITGSSVTIDLFYDNVIPQCGVSSDYTRTGTVGTIALSSCAARPGLTLSARAPEGSNVDFGVIALPYESVSTGNTVTIPEYHSKVFYYDFTGEQSYRSVLDIEYTLSSSLNVYINSNERALPVVYDNCIANGPNTVSRTHIGTTFADTLSTCGINRLFFYVSNPTNTEVTMNFVALTEKKSSDVTSISRASATTVDTTTSFLSQIAFDGAITEFDYLFVKVTGATGSFSVSHNSCSDQTYGVSDEVVIVFTYDDLYSARGGVDNIFIEHNAIGSIEIFWDVKQAIVYDYQFVVNHRNLFDGDNYVHVYRYESLSFETFSYTASSCNTGSLRVYGNNDRVRYSGTSDLSGSISNSNSCYNSDRDVYVSVVAPSTRADQSQPIEYSFRAQFTENIENNIFVTSSAVLNLTLTDLSKSIIFRPTPNVPRVSVFGYVRIIPGTLESVTYVSNERSYSSCAFGGSSNTLYATQGTREFLFSSVCQNDIYVTFIDELVTNPIDRDTVVVQVVFEELPFYYQHGIGKVANKANLKSGILQLSSPFNYKKHSDYYRITHPETEKIESRNNYPLDLDTLYSYLVKVKLTTSNERSVDFSVYGRSSYCYGPTYFYNNIYRLDRIYTFNNFDHLFTVESDSSNSDNDYDLSIEYGDFHEKIDVGVEYCIDLDNSHSVQEKFFRLNQVIKPEQYYVFEATQVLENSVRNIPFTYPIDVEVDFVSSGFTSPYNLNVYSEVMGTTLRCIDDQYVNNEFLSLRVTRNNLFTPHKLKLKVDIMDANVTTIDHSVNTQVEYPFYKYEVPERDNNEPILIRYYNAYSNPLQIGFNAIATSDSGCNEFVCYPDAQGYCTFQFTQNNGIDKLNTIYFNAPQGSYIRVEDLSVHTPLPITTQGVYSQVNEGATIDVNNALDYEIIYYRGEINGNDLSVSFETYDNNVYSFYDYYFVSNRFYTSLSNHVTGNIDSLFAIVPRRVRQLCYNDLVSIDINFVNDFTEYTLIENAYLNIEETLSKTKDIVLKTPTEFTSSLALIDVFTNPFTRPEGTYSLYNSQYGVCLRNYPAGESAQVTVITPTAYDYGNEQTVNLVAKLITPFELVNNQLHQAQSKYYTRNAGVTDLYFFNNDKGSKRIEIVVENGNLIVDFDVCGDVSELHTNDFTDVRCSSSQSECAIEARHGNFPTFNGKVYFTVKTTGNYTIKLVSKTDNCVPAKGLPGIGFCTADILPSSFWVSQDVAAADALAETIFYEFIENIDQCDLSDECIKALKKYSCFATFKSCDSEFGVTRYVDGPTCSNVETACGQSWKQLNDVYESLSCDSSIYEYEGSSDISSSMTLFFSLVIALLAIMM